MHNGGVSQDPKRPPARGIADRVVGSVVGPLVRPVIDAVDVDDVAERIDVNELLSRVDLESLIARIDPQQLLDRIDVNQVVARVDVNELVARIDPQQLLDRIDVNELMARVDADEVVARVDPDALVDRVDVNRLLDRVDLNRLLDRVDANAVVERVDLDQMMARIDVNALVKRTELGEVIARSTTGVFGQLVDVGRTAMMSVDLVLHGTLGRLARRDPWLQTRPGAPEVPTPIRGLPAAERAVALQGHHAGAVSRFVAFLIDTTVAATLFTLLTGLGVLALDRVVGVTWVAEDHRPLVAALLVAWQIAYFAAPTALTGRTVGKAALGVRVVDPDGEPVGAWHALARTVFFPVSFLVFGMGFLLALVRRDRRMLHDLVGRTAVVYSWDAEVARLRAHADHTDGHGEPHETVLLQPHLSATPPTTTSLFDRSTEGDSAPPSPR